MTWRLNHIEEMEVVRWHHRLSGRDSGDWMPPPPPTQRCGASDMQQSDSHIPFFLCQILFHYRLAIKYSSVSYTAVVQSLSRVWLFVAPGTAAHQAPPSFTISQSFAQTHAHWVGDVIPPSHPLSSRSPVLNPSQHQGLLRWVLPSHQVAKVQELQL